MIQVYCIGANVCNDEAQSSCSQWSGKGKKNIFPEDTLRKDHFLISDHFKLKQRNSSLKRALYETNSLDLVP